MDSHFNSSHKPMQEILWIFLNIYYNLKLFFRRYLDLLADGLHSKFNSFGLKTISDVREADIAIIDYNLRETYVSYSSWICHIPTKFAIRAARRLDKTFILEKPFDVMIWICIPFSFFIILFTSYGIMKKETELRNKEMPKFSTLFWIILRNFLRQDTNVDRYFLITFRILIGCWILIAFVLTSAYLGTLPSFIVNPGTETIPHTFQELAQSVKKGRYNITLSKNSYAYFYFDGLLFDEKYGEGIINNDDKIFYENVLSFNYNPTYWYIRFHAEPIKKVLNGTHAFIESRQIIDLSMTKQQKQEVFISEDTFFTEFKFIRMNLVKVNYAVEIAKTVNRIEQSGLSQKIDRDIIDEKTRKDSFYYDKTIDTNNEKPLEMDDIRALIYLLVTGYLIASVVFFTEIFVDKIKKLQTENAE
ncbi:uncharacterized protein [Centruroides vittatus]|uniref:uncharacterized protein n=1 Tax=Centruroides vittatus TaxID=120091 RepID=UPI00350F123F